MEAPISLVYRRQGIFFYTKKPPRDSTSLGDKFTLNQSSSTNSTLPFSRAATLANASRR